MAFLTSSASSFHTRLIFGVANLHGCRHRRAAAALIRHSSSKWTWLKLPWSQTKENKYICTEIKKTWERTAHWNASDLVRFECEMPSSGNGKGSTPTAPSAINAGAYHTNALIALLRRTHLYMKIHFSLILIDVDGFVTTLLPVVRDFLFYPMLESVAYRADHSPSEYKQAPKIKWSREHNLAFQRI